MRKDTWTIKASLTYISSNRSTANSLTYSPLSEKWDEIKAVKSECQGQLEQKCDFEHMQIHPFMVLDLLM